MDKEELQIIQQIQKGDFDLFTTLYDKYFKKIYTFLLLKSNWNVHLTEDVTSETFMKAFENITKFDATKEDSSFSARLYKIAYRNLVDSLKRKKSEELSDPDSIVVDQDYIDYFQKNVQVEQILSYLWELWTDKKDLFTLRIRNNLSYDEIWEVLGKRSSSCRKEFSRLIRKISEHFKYWIED